MPVKNLYKAVNINLPYWYDLGIDNLRGTFVGSPQIQNNYVSFNGNIRVELPNTIGQYKANHLFNLTFHLRSTKNDSNIHTIFSNRRTGSTRGYFAIYIDENEKIQFTTITAYYEEVTNSSLRTICDGKWHLIHCQRDSGYQKIFIDGVLESQLSTSSQGSDDLYNNPLPRIGAESSGGGGAHNRYLTGDMKMIIHRNSALSLAEIKNEFAYYFGYI